MKQAPATLTSALNLAVGMAATSGPTSFLKHGEHLVSQLLALALLSGFTLQAHAQSFCASDGHARPALLLERFVNADCAECWRAAATPALPRGGLAVDWVVPGRKEDDAPMAAVASRDALSRLEALDQAPPSGLWHQSKPVGGGQATDHRRASAYRLRAAHGMVFNGYVGVAIELKPLSATSPARQDGPWRAWLALVESVPAGTEGSPVDRQLVRNLLVLPWSMQQAGGLERRAMALPEGTNPERISVIAWLEDKQGRVQTAVHTRCTDR